MAKKRSYGIQLVITGKNLAKATLQGLAKGLRAPIDAVKKLGAGFGSLVEKVPGIYLLGRAVGSVARETVALVRGLGDYAGDVIDLSARTGIGTDLLQEFGFAAQKVGINTEQSSAALQKFTATLGKGVNSKSLFSSLGRQTAGFVRALKAAKSPTDQLELVLATMASIPDATKRAAFAVNFFGESGVKFSAMAADGAEGLRALRREAGLLGNRLSQDDLKLADEFGDKWESLTMAFEGTKRDFGMGLIEGLTPGLEELLKYVKENRKEVGAFLRDLGKSVGTGIVDAAKGIVSAVKWIVANKDTIIDVMKWVGIGVAALLGLSALSGILAVLAKAPFFAALSAAVAGVKWLLATGAKGFVPGWGKGAPAASAAGAGARGAATAATVGRLGTMGLAGAVAGPAAAALLLNPTDMEQDSQDDARRIAEKRWGPGLARLGMSLDSPGMPHIDPLIFAENREGDRNIIEGWSKMGSALAVADIVNAGGFEGLMRKAMGPVLDWGGGAKSEVEVKVVVEDRSGATDGAPEVKAAGAVQVKAETRGATGRRAQSYAEGGGP
jgi:hypothetical protein